MNKSTLILSVALFVAACAGSNNRYMAASEPGDFGYYEQALADDRYRVVYKSKGDNLAEAKDYALLRSAELTLQKGYTWFEIVDRSTTQSKDDDHDNAVADMRIHATTYRECGILACRTVTHPTYIESGFANRPTSARESTATIIEIKMGAGAKPDAGRFYDAAKLADTIRERQ
ncbi:CC0125/CC1285 family lipoprotein [Kordiimonas lacus]|uniref:Lipoprotein n=1 Tax=Kordiimonas lacus TaxID=637679 RepID=A0A1G6Y978_9PROT|nr:hypothetical protein [Kordiimonas lacus]SDD86910.1 hypothetical protein SAMN04488071_1534 [Kordiimonas lacus]